MNDNRTATRPTLLQSLQQLWPFKTLIRQLAVRDLKAKYKVSALGFFWSLLRPLLTIVVLAAVFSTLQLTSTRYSVWYPTLLLVTYLPWFYFSLTLLEGTQSLISNSNLVKKVYCPRAVFPISVVLANLVNFVFSLLVLFPVLYLFLRVTPQWPLLYLPLIIITHTAFLLGLSFILSVINVLYRDTTQIIEFVAFVWFYISPVLYDVYDIFEVVTANQKLVMVLYFLNPMSGILEWYRYSFLSSELTKGQENPLVSQLNTFIFYGAIPYAIIASFAMLIIGYWALKKLETRAVDEL